MVFFFLFVLWLFAPTSLNCGRTAEARCPPCYDDVLLGTFSGIAGQGVAHSHIPVLGWQAAVQVEARVYISFRVQLKETTRQSLKCQSSCMESLRTLLLLEADC